MEKEEILAVSIYFSQSSLFFSSFLLFESSFHLFVQMKCKNYLFVTTVLFHSFELGSNPNNSLCQLFLFFEIIQFLVNLISSIASCIEKWKMLQEIRMWSSQTRTLISGTFLLLYFGVCGVIRVVALFKT